MNEDESKTKVQSLCIGGTDNDDDKPPQVRMISFDIHDCSWQEL
jgi:hypothetical protein